MMIIFLAVIGFGVSLYAYLIKNRLKVDSSYHPICDLSDAMSCTKPIKSPYGSLFGVSNALAGMIYYAAVLVLVVMHMSVLLFYLTLVGVLVSIYLAYLLYFRIRTVCLLCTATYVINIILLVAVYFAY